jgi:hypothetical protein
MPRAYTVVFEGVSVSAAQDLFQIKGAAGKLLRIKRVVLNATDTTPPAAQMIQARMRYLPVTVTDGSGGTAPTPQPLDPGDAAASFTAKVNNTTQATTNGTAVKLWEGGFYVLAGLDYSFAQGREPVVGPSESFTVEMLSAPSPAIHLSGTVEVEESGG